MNGQNFEPSPELQALIDEAHDRRLRERQDSEWTSGRGVVIDPDALKQRAEHWSRVQASSATAFSYSSASAEQYAAAKRFAESLTFFGA